MSRSTIAEVARAAREASRRTLEGDAVAAVTAWLGDPEGLTLEVAHIDDREGLVVVSDGTTCLARDRHGEMHLVEVEADGKVVKRGRPSDPADLARLLADDA